MPPITRRDRVDRDWRWAKKGNEDMRTTLFRIVRLAGAGAGIAFAFHTASAQAAKTYFIDESTSFPDCLSGTLNDVTSSLQTSLNDNSWSGYRLANASAYPQDFWEACSTTYGSGGVDTYYGDARVLSVYAGHGGPHTVYFGYKHNNQCVVNFTSNMRLGAMNGATAGFGMWLECEVIQSSELGTAMYQRLRQQAGWQNSIGIGDNEPRDFFNATNTKTNADAWLDQMGGGGRDPIIATFSSTSGSCWPIHNAAKLRGNAYNSTLGGGPSCGGAQTLYYYCYEHG